MSDDGMDVNRQEVKEEESAFEKIPLSSYVNQIFGLSSDSNKYCELIQLEFPSRQEGKRTTEWMSDKLKVYVN